MLIGKLCRLTYEQISVVFNLWLQGAVLTLSAILPAAMSILLLCRGFSVLRLLLVFFSCSLCHSPYLGFLLDAQSLSPSFR